MVFMHQALGRLSLLGGDMAIGLRLYYWGLVFALSACGAPQTDNRAPQNQEEAGYILSGQPEEIDPILQSGTSYRVISKKHNIYEVHGIENRVLQIKSPSLKVERNLYLNNMIETDKQSKLERVYQGLIANDSSESQDNLPKALMGCDFEQSLKPQSTISITSDTLSQSITMELGQIVRFSGSKSLSNTHSQALQLIWDVIPPKLSALPMNQPHVSEEFELKPDSVGIYQVILVAQDSNQACDIEMIRFLVTHNPDVETTSRPSSQNLSGLELQHLEQIQAKKSWLKSTGKDIVVAVLDTGLHYNHPAIQNNLAINANEMNSKADMDNNGYNGDFIGWDFVNHDNRPFDDHGHGSHVSGLVSAQRVGSAQSARIMPLKVLNAAGGGDVASIIAAIYYAVDNGAHVINASMQRLDTHLDSLKDAITYAHSKNVVFVSSAGNDSLDLSLPGVDIYPGEMVVPNVINVGAVDSNNQLASYSNYGLGQVHVVAPGGDSEGPIHSLATLNPHDIDYVPSRGTSMAAPIVAGIVAQMIQANPNISSDEIKEILMKSGSQDSKLKTVVASGRVVNASEAVDLAEELHLRNHLF